MKKIDIDKWERKSHYNWFSSFLNPSLSFTVRMNITKILHYSKQNKISSFALIMFVICECINDNKACRLRVLNNNVYEIEYANVAYTIMVNENTFVNCRARTHFGFNSFLEDVKRNQEKYSNSNFIQEEYNDISIVNDIYCSCVPWIDFISVTQPIPENIPESKSIPRVVWGKYIKENNNDVMSLSINVNHALVDGNDVSTVYSAIQKAFDNIEEFIKNKL